ncbi:MAG: DNA repair protein RadC [Prevotellaceae bacterium]|jgi:DNA repair protein RadC|nr:DNA repair protein RadC [Prevotellaceae bacterium]
MSFKHLTIREWSEDDRPREKMLQKGSEALSNTELLAILLRTGNQHETAVELSRSILSDCGDNLNELARISIKDLSKRYKGIGTTKAVTIKAALELGKRRQVGGFMEKKQIVSSRDLFELFTPILIDLPYEEFWVAVLNNANKLIKVQRLTQGGTAQTVVDIPMLLKIAIENNASAIAVAHNHPSGNNTGSKSDELVTKKIKTACTAVEIRFIDHVIIAKDNYFSFADNTNLI